jgi:cytochrome c-type biogenesis protein CcmF
MLIEIGHFALILALVFALLQVILPTLGLIRANIALSQVSRPLLWMQFFWILVSFFIFM